MLATITDCWFKIHKELKYPFKQGRRKVFAAMVQHAHSVLQRADVLKLKLSTCGVPGSFKLRILISMTFHCIKVREREIGRNYVRKKGNRYVYACVIVFFVRDWTRFRCTFCSTAQKWDWKVQFENHLRRLWPKVIMGTEFCDWKWALLW